MRASDDGTTRADWAAHRGDRALVERAAQGACERRTSPTTTARRPCSEAAVFGDAAHHGAAAEGGRGRRIGQCRWPDGADARRAHRAMSRPPKLLLQHGAHVNATEKLPRPDGAASGRPRKASRQMVKSCSRASRQRRTRVSTIESSTAPGHRASRASQCATARRHDAAAVCGAPGLPGMRAGI